LNHARYRDWFESETVADISALTGQTLPDLKAADAAALELIRSGGPERDDDVVRAMHRRQLRFSMIVAGTDPNRENPLFHRLDPILE